MHASSRCVATRDGHDFVGSAFAGGAAVALVDRAPAGVTLHPGRALVHVGDTLAALQQVARSLRIDRSELVVVAVGGSTGKTSTKDLLAAALAPRGCHANAESYNNEFGLPITLCNAPEAARVVVTEMGERFAGDLALLCDIARPNIGVVTNVGPRARRAPRRSRRDAVGARRAPRSPPERRVRGAQRRRRSDTEARRALRGTRGHGRDGVARRLPHRGCRAGRCTCARRSRCGGQRFSVPLHGIHQAQNAALAIAVAHEAFAIPLSDIAVALEAARPAPAGACSCSKRTTASPS